MAVKILEIKRENCPAARLIGKRYPEAPNWGEWWENNWFDILEKITCLDFNGDAYIGAARIVNGSPETWIGMLYPAGTDAPEGFDFVDIEPTTYAVCYIYDHETSGEFYTNETHEMCIEELKSMGFRPKSDNWRFERYNCPRFTTPDDNGYVTLDYAISVED